MTCPGTFRPNAFRDNAPSTQGEGMKRARFSDELKFDSLSLLGVPALQPCLKNFVQSAIHPPGY